MPAPTVAPELREFSQVLTSVETDVMVAIRTLKDVCVATVNREREVSRSFQETLQGVTADMNRYFADWQQAVAQVQDLQGQLGRLLETVEPTAKVLREVFSRDECRHFVAQNERFAEGVRRLATAYQHALPKLAALEDRAEKAEAELAALKKGLPTEGHGISGKERMPVPSPDELCEWLARGNGREYYTGARDAMDALAPWLPGGIYVRMDTVDGPLTATGSKVVDGPGPDVDGPLPSMAVLYQIFGGAYDRARGYGAEPWLLGGLPESARLSWRAGLQAVVDALGVESLRRTVSTLRERMAALHFELERLREAHRMAECIHCHKKFARDEDLQQHIRNCTQHPLSRALREIATLELQRDGARREKESLEKQVADLRVRHDAEKDALRGNHENEIQGVRALLASAEWREREQRLLVESLASDMALEEFQALEVHVRGLMADAPGGALGVSTGTRLAQAITHLGKERRILRKFKSRLRTELWARKTAEALAAAAVES